MYADILKGCKSKAKKTPEEAKKEEMAHWFGVVSKSRLTSSPKRFVPDVVLRGQPGSKKTIQPIIGTRKEEADFFQGVLKTSEGARKAWLTRGGKTGQPSSGKSWSSAQMQHYNSKHSRSSGSKTLDAIRASAKTDEAARAQFRQMSAKKSAAYNQLANDLGLL